MDFIPPETTLIASLQTPPIGLPQTFPATFAEKVAEQTESAYEAAQLDPERFSPEPDLFYTDEYAPRLTEMIDHVIEQEGPIHEEVLVRRIARFHGFKRAGNQIQDIVLAIAKRRQSHSREKSGLFFWPKEGFEERLAPTRWKGRDDEMRKVEYICQEEIRAIDKLLGTNGDPVELARNLGISRLSQFARERLSEAMGE